MHNKGRIEVILQDIHKINDKISEKNILEKGGQMIYFTNPHVFRILKKILRST